MPPNAETRVALVGRDVRGGDVVGDRGAARVRVLDDHGRRSVAELVHEPPRRFGVVEVEVREVLAAVLDRVVPPARRTAEAVSGAGLVRVLAVAQLLGTLEGERERRRQRVRVVVGQPG